MLDVDLIRPVPELLAGQAAARSGAMAFRDDRVVRTWAQLHERTGRLAGHLGALGATGGCVAIVMENRVELAESYLAAVRAGAVAACLNARSGDGELAFMIADCGAGLLITEASQLERVRGMLAGVGRDVRLIVADLPAGSADMLGFEDLAGTAPPAPAGDALPLHAPAFMLYTSGTTGRPKGVLLSQHSCLWVVAACWAPALELTPDDLVLSPLPLFHSYALDLSVLAVVAVGCAIRLLPRFSPSRVIELLRADPVTVFPGVPTMYDYLDRTLGGEPLGAAALRVCVSAGAIMGAELNERFERAAGVPLLDGYGIKVMLGYHDRPEATAEALRDGWYHTGDLARSDDCGYLSITGRIKELIIRGGENIYPAEVEQVLVRHPAVLDAAVAGEPHPALGEVPVAFVVARDPGAFDPADVRAFVTSHLAEWKVPARFQLIEAVPRTGSGKTQRRRLFELT
jgi:rifamycin polyketide synthase module 1/2/3